jgi:hypothetical protein
MVAEAQVALKGGFSALDYYSGSVCGKLIQERPQERVKIGYVNFCISHLV